MNLFQEATVSHSNGRFVIKCPFDWNSQLKADGWNWDGRHKEWITTAPEVAKKYQSYADPQTQEIITAGVKFMNDSYRLSKALDANFEVAHKKLQPFPYQRAGVAYIVSRKNTLLGDVPGLGKTSQAILSINHIRPATTLIVCPKSLKINWMRELEMWMTIVRNVDILKGEWRPFTEIGIIHYDILHKMKDTIDSMEFDMLIVDEAHHCKTPTTRKSKMVMAIKAKRKIYMTGTPVVNRPKELWPLIHSLDPDRWQTFTHFAERYCKDEADENYRPTRGKKFGQYNGAANLDELQKILRGTIMVRRSKEEVLPQLPGKMRQVVELEADASVQRAIADGVREYKELENRVEKLSDVVQKLKKGGNEESYKQAVESLKEANLEKFSVLARQRVESARMKLPYVLQYLEELLEDSDEKYIIFGHHKEMLGALNEKFADCSVRIDGSVTSEQRRQDAVDQFQNDPKIRFFFGQFTAAGVGITLTASSNVIFVEMDWVPGNISQCEDRSCRIGQKNTVHVMHIVLEGSIDSYIMKKVIEKQDVIERTVDHQRL